MKTSIASKRDIGTGRKILAVLLSCILVMSLLPAPAFAGSIVIKTQATDISSATLSTIYEQTWAGRAMTPEPTVTYSGTPLVKDTDYTLSYTNNVNLGTATVTATGIGSYTGTVSENFTITPFVYHVVTDGSEVGNGAYIQRTILDMIHGVVPATLGGVDVVSVNIGSPGFTSLDISANTQLKVLDCSFNQLTSLDISANTQLIELYCGSNQITSLNVSGNTQLISLSCYNNQLTSLDVSANTQLTQLDCDSNQLTSLDASANTQLQFLDCSFNQLTSLDVSANTRLKELYCHGNQLTSFDISSSTQLIELYCGSNQITSLDVSSNTQLIDLSCLSNQLTSLDISANTQLTALYCQYNYIADTSVLEAWLATPGHSGQVLPQYARNIADAGVAPISDVTYTGSAITPLPVVTYGATTLTAGSDYTLAYSGNTSVGSATITITGTGHYAGTQEVSFNIVAADIASASIAPVSNQVWTGSAITPAPVLTFNGATLLADTDYTLSYSNNVSVGTATITITGTGNFTSTTSTTFDIVGRDIADASVAPISDVTYTGSAITPLPVVTYGATTLTAGSDYTLAYADNTSVGSATITITGIGSYTGTTSTTFNIIPKSIASSVIAPISKKLYVGIPVEPTLAVSDGATTLTLGVDYTKSYTNNTVNGTATATITGIGNYTATNSTDFTVVRFSDVSYDMWYITDGWLTYVVENDLMSGYAGTTEFGPLDFISRGQVATILYRAACNEDPSLIAIYGSTIDPSNYATTAVFDDEATGVYYTAAINWAKAVGVMTGYGPEYTHVAPDNLISREELCAMITRYVRVIDPVKGAQTGPVDYSHIQGMDEVSDWALANVEWCASWGIIGGVNRGSGILVMNPHDAAWRASMAKMITVSIRDVIG